MFRQAPGPSAEAARRRPRKRQSRLTTLVLLLGLSSGGVVGAALPVGAAPAWKIATTPQLAAGTFGELFGISCPTEKSCYAVGHVTQPSGYKTLVEHWNGNSWKLMPTPASGRSRTLTAIDCWSDANCMAVGFTAVPQNEERPFDSLAERWDGTTWSVAATPQVAGNPYTVLDGVSCPTATKCYGIGYQGPGVDGLVENWNGSSWTVMSTPHGASFLFGIACATAANCTAVGDNNNAANGFAERWNGTKWTATRMAKIPGAEDTAFHGISCLSSTNCDATGMSFSGSGPGGKAIVERWNGTTWSIQSSAPNRAPALLNGVTCLNPTTCYAAGFDDAVPAAHTLIERLNGSTWSRTPSPDLPSHSDNLNGLACANATHCFSVGTGFHYPAKSDAGYDPLILSYT